MTFITPKIVLGTNAFGSFNEKDCHSIVRHLKRVTNSSSIEIDTALSYNNSEKRLSIFSNDTNDILISTKVNSFSIKQLDLSRESVIKQCNICLQRLKRTSIDILYIHSPQQSMPILETLLGINDLYKEKKFKRFGICHYSAWKVCEIVKLCEKHSLVCPSVYQGRYNIFRREIESELLPCLRYFNIAYYAFSPTARGILAGNHEFEDLENGRIAKGRFTSNFANLHFFDYWRKSFFDGRKIIYNAIAMENKNIGGNKEMKLLLLETIFSWLMFHSHLDGGKGDAIIVGGSKLQHFEQNLNAILNAKKLSVNMKNVIDVVWHKYAKKECINYHRTTEELVVVVQQGLQFASKL